jgi:hypothetical protein
LPKEGVRIYRDDLEHLIDACEAIREPLCPASLEFTNLDQREQIADNAMP